MSAMPMAKPRVVVFFTVVAAGEETAKEICGHYVSLGMNLLKTSTLEKSS